MLNFYKDNEYDKIFKEILNESLEVRLLDKSFKFGAASVVASLYNWCDQLNNGNIKEIKPDDIKKAFADWISSDLEVNLMFNRLLENDKSR